MELKATQLGKRFNNEWIFRKLDFVLQESNSLVITGPNGSGKSTLLNVLSGYLSSSEGDIILNVQNKHIQQTQIQEYSSIAAPYLELIEELTLDELIRFHFKFVPLSPIVTLSEVADYMQLTKSKSKTIKHFSSGMKQRVKLGLAFLTLKPTLLLDEPTINLDFEGIKWYEGKILELIPNKITVISSNDPKEYFFSSNTLNILDYK
ncbi:MAG: ATPase, T2SS/T4P/T4SS family [Bacteroidota bacterium]|nr:ATPase, T2SS/T4P/T4SS family [Bacteroidota bacterium]